MRIDYFVIGAMRLSLRTLLAFEDNVFDVAQHRQLEQVIPQNETASQILCRLRNAARNPQLDVPGLVDGQEELDPNYVAEYLDHQMPSDLQDRFENYCLSGDKYLAELSSVHQILSNVLGEPARTSRECRLQCYTAGHQENTASLVKSQIAGTAETENQIPSQKIKIFNGNDESGNSAALSPPKKEKTEEELPEMILPPKLKRVFIVLWDFFRNAAKAGVLLVLLFVILGIVYWGNNGFSGSRFSGRGTAKTPIQTPKQDSRLQNISPQPLSLDEATQHGDKQVHAAPDAHKPASSVVDSAASDPFLAHTHSGGAEKVAEQQPAKGESVKEKEFAAVPDDFGNSEWNGVPDSVSGRKQKLVSSKKDTVKTDAVRNDAPQSHLQTPKSEHPIEFLSEKQREQTMEPAKPVQKVIPISAWKETPENSFAPKTASTVTPAINPQNKNLIIQTTAVETKEQKLGRILPPPEPQVLFSASSSDSQWGLATQASELSAEQYLLTTVPFRSAVELAAGYRIEMVGDAKICILAPDAKGISGIYVDYGRIVIYPLQNNKPLRLETEKVQGTLSVNSTETVLFIDTFAEVSQPDAEKLEIGEKPKMTAILGFIPNGGTLTWKAGKLLQPFTADKQGSMILQQGNYLFGEIQSLPNWLKTPPQAPEDKKTAEDVRRIFNEVQGNTEAALNELIRSDTLGLQALGYRFWGDLGRFDVPLAAMAAKKPENEAVRKALAPYFNEVMKRDGETVQRFAESINKIREKKTDNAR